MSLKPKQKEAPDPIATAQAQGEANVESAIASALLNQPSSIGPEGTVTFEQTGSQNVGGNIIPSFTRVTELTPEGQAQFEAQQQLGGSLTGLAQEQTGRIGEALGQGIDATQLPALQGGVVGGDIQQQFGEDFAQQGREVTEATFQQGLGLLDPSFARQRADAELQLTERGLPLGSESARRILDPVAEQQNRARNQLALAAIEAGRQEQGRLFGQAGQQAQFANQAQNLGFNQAAAAAAASNAARAQGFQEQAFERSLPINDIAALLGTAPGVQGPQFQAQPAFGVQSPDVIGATLGAANIDQQNFAARSGLFGGALGGLFGLGSSIIENPGIFSDIRLKTNIRKIGKTSKGFNLYKYTKFGIEEIGVMAQEVIKVIPSAVVEKDGYYAVKYGMVN